MSAGQDHVGVPGGGRVFSCLRLCYTWAVNGWASVILSSTGIKLSLKMCWAHVLELLWAFLWPASCGHRLTCFTSWQVQLDDCEYVKV